MNENHNQPVKIIPTKFNGIEYRSRTEARWAVFFTTLNIPFDYEPEAFAIGDTGYLPDFFLPLQNCYVEIKGTDPTEQEQIKARALAQFSGMPVVIFSGAPKMPMDENLPANGDYLESGRIYLPTGTEDTGYWWCECPRCGILGIQFEGRSDRLPCKCQKSAHGDKGRNYETNKLRFAYDSARSFRFDEWRNG